MVKKDLKPISGKDSSAAQQEESFADMVKEVTPLHFLPKANSPSPCHARTRRRMTACNQQDIPSPQPCLDIPDIDYETQIPPTHFYKNGINKKQLLRGLGKKRHTIELSADFHGMDRYTARHYFCQIMQTVKQEQCRCIALIHGKSHQSTRGFSVLRVYLHRWLQEEESLLAYFPSPSQEGGDGVTLAFFKRTTHDNEADNANPYPMHDPLF